MTSGAWVSGFLHLPPSAPPSCDCIGSGGDSASGSHCYVVWAVPAGVDQGQVVGIHTGGGLRAWRALESQFGTYSYKREHRLKKAATILDALVVFTSESTKHGVTDQQSIFDQ